MPFLTIFKRALQQRAEIDFSKQTQNMELGAFSISLNVQDPERSKGFYENFGVNISAGGSAQNCFIMKNERALIGLFQGMFEGNIFTFNPGWDENAQNLEEFTDVRELQKQLKRKGVNFICEADEETSGPAGFVLKDPDGNMILIDQHR